MSVLVCREGFWNVEGDCTAEAQSPECPTRLKLLVAAELVFLGVILWNMWLHVLGGPQHVKDVDLLELVQRRP